MKKTTLYPFNKISQGLIRFRDLLDFEICSVIDFVFGIGDDAGEKIDGKKSKIRITDKVEEGLKDIDTLILNDPGTTFSGNEKIFEEHNIIEKWREMVKKANKMGIKVISVHEIFDEDTKIWMKKNNILIDIGRKMNFELLNRLDVLDIKEESVHQDIYKYLKSFEVDIDRVFPKTNIKKIAIMATRGCLGKFTTQMSLFRELKRENKKAVALITEPTAFLFKQYDADLPKFLAEKSWSKYPYYINELVKKADMEGNEYIILSGQGSLTPNKHIRLDITKIGILEAFNPDITLLVAGYGDDRDVNDCIELLKIYGGYKPLAIVIPDKVEMEYGKYDFKTPEQIKARKRELKERFGIQYVELIEDIYKIKDLIVEN